MRARHDKVVAEGQPKLFAVMAGGVFDGLINIEIELTYNDTPVADSQVTRCWKSVF